MIRYVLAADGRHYRSARRGRARSIPSRSNTGLPSWSVRTHGGHFARKLELQRPRRGLAPAPSALSGTVAASGAVGGGDRAHPPGELIERADGVAQRPRSAGQLAGAGERAEVQQRREPAGGITVGRGRVVALDSGRPRAATGRSRRGTAARRRPARSSRRRSVRSGRRPTPPATARTATTAQGPSRRPPLPARAPARRSPRAPDGAAARAPALWRPTPPDPTQAPQQPQTSPQQPPTPADPPSASRAPPPRRLSFPRTSSAALALEAVGALARVTPVL